MSDTQNTAVVDAPAVDKPNPVGSRTYDTVQDAVAELERRDAARRQEARKAKAEKAAAVEKTQEPDEPADDEDADPRRVKKQATEDDEDDAPKQKRKRVEDEESDDDESAEDDDSSDEDEDVATDDDEDKPAKKAKATEDDDPSLDEIEHEGKTYKVPKAIKDAQLRHADYTKKTQELAQVRQHVSEQSQATEALMAQLQRAQGAVVQMAQQMVGQPPPLSLAQSDPGAYMVAKEAHAQRVASLQQLVGQGGELTRQQQQQQEAAKRAALTEEAQHMARVMPALADPAKRQQFLSAAVESAARSGFTADDVSAIDDHRMLHLVGRLMAAEARLQQLQATGKSVSEKLANIPPKVNKPGVANSNQGNGERARKAKSEFMKSGRTMRDVQRYLESTTR